jgi:hypothetical protein
MKARFDFVGLRGLKWTLIPIFAGWTALAQPSFNSTSTGSDGALNLTTQGTILFDPTTFTPPLNPSGNNIYNFTTINIAAGVTVRLSARNLTGPIYWLATGAVTIAGTLDLTGEAGGNTSNSEETRSPAYPGAGGYTGGQGGRPGSPALPPTPGNGPGGGAAGASGANGAVGTLTGTNVFLVPLVGGSGGGGGPAYDINTVGAGGGAGGGAILIASSTSISINGKILVGGGAGGTCPYPYYTSCGGAGSGGAIHLIAPTVSGNGTLSANANSLPAGEIRIEASSYPNSLTLTLPFTVSSTPNLYLPTTPPPTLKVVSVAGVALPAVPTGSFTVPDANINSSAAVPVVIQAAYIPPGTVPTLQFFSDIGGTDFSVTVPALSGTLAQSTATVQVTFPAGFTRGYVLASW